MLSIIFHRDVRDDIKSSYQWYERQAEGLGEDFLKELEASFKHIAETPELYSVMKPPIRRCVLQKFPFSVLYRIRTDVIYVVAVMHNRRKPSYWHKRLL